MIKQKQFTFLRALMHTRFCTENAYADQVSDPFMLEKSNGLFRNKKLEITGVPLPTTFENEVFIGHFLQDFREYN